MILSSKDIKKRDFKKSLRGYDTDELDAFLEIISTHYDKLVLENRNQSDRIKSLLQDIDLYKENELNLQKAIIKSQEVGEQIIENAKRKSEIMIREADLEVRTIKQKLDDELLNKKQELEEIKQRNEKTFEDVKHFLNDKLNELEEFYKNRKILKMELTDINYSNDEEIDEKEEMPKPMKKVYLSNQSPQREDSSFDDSFEIKK